MVMICEAMGWTYEQYRQNPQWFIELLIMKKNLDYNKEKREADKLKNKYGR